MNSTILTSSAVGAVLSSASVKSAMRIARPMSSTTVGALV